MQCNLNSFFLNIIFMNWEKIYSTKTACWSPDESVLLFSCADSSLLYCLKFLPHNKQELQIVCDLSSIVLCDTSSESVTNEANEINLSKIPQLSVGGSIYNICWDPSGQRLAVSFKSNYIWLQNVFKHSIIIYTLFRIW